jgi:solute carrier family 25 carnitine/acylcarnitine transporter 20/29
LKYQLTPKDTDAGMQAMLFSGAAAGVVTWGSTYPFDVIKSIQQTSPDLKKVPSMLEVFKVNYKAHGNTFFWRGLGPTLARAVPVNAVTFVVYEKVLATLTAMNDADEAC